MLDFSFEKYAHGLKPRNKNMNLQQIRTAFEAGGVTNPIITHSMMNDKWEVMFDVRQKENINTVVLISKRGKTREFRTIEAVISVLEELGFKTVTVAFG